MGPQSLLLDLFAGIGISIPITFSELIKTEEKNKFTSKPQDYQTYPGHLHDLQTMKPEFRSRPSEL